MITIRCGNEVIERQKPCFLYELIPNTLDPEQVYAGVWNGTMCHLHTLLTESGTLSFIMADSLQGQMVYQRTLHFLFLAAMHTLQPDVFVGIQHSISNGVYCKFSDASYANDAFVLKIQAEMKRMIQAHTPIERIQVPLKQAATHFRNSGFPAKAELLEKRKNTVSSVYRLANYDDYFYGILLPDVHYIQTFSIRAYEQGVWLSSQTSFQPQPKLFSVFEKNENWGRQIQVTNVADLNRKILQQEFEQLVLLSETRMEQELSALAIDIAKRKDVKFVLIAGPSSAGKTTFSRRLAIHLQVLGWEPFPISMDDFFKNRCDTPKLEDGSYDFESIDALDIVLFEDVLQKLLTHVPVHLPIFDFKSGKQHRRKDASYLSEKQILLIEGLHALNPQIIASLPQSSVYRVYINACTHLNLDPHNYITTSDYRLIRRMVRDHAIRGTDAIQTLAAWPKVKAGEEKNIYPYQEYADVIFNTSMVYELAILKNVAWMELVQIPKTSPQYLEANRILKLLEYIDSARSDAIPRYSILAEFLGNSILDVA